MGGVGGGQGGQGEKDALKREDCQEKEWEKQEEADSKPSHPDLLLIT